MNTAFDVPRGANNAPLSPPIQPVDLAQPAGLNSLSRSDAHRHNSDHYARSVAHFADPELEQWRLAFAERFGEVKAYPLSERSDPFAAPRVRALLRPFERTT